jgi:hypothetical protein
MRTLRVAWHGHFLVFSQQQIVDQNIQSPI